MTSNFNKSQQPVVDDQIPTVENQQMSSWEAPKKPLRGWRLWVPLLLQTALIGSVPAQAIYTHLTGTTVILQTAPVDPYDLLRGYYQTLSYDISNQNNLKNLAGWNDLPGGTTTCPTVKPPAKSTCKPEKYLNSNTEFYVILEAPKTAATSGRPQPWKPVRVSEELPNQLRANQVALKGKYTGRIEYGLEQYFMPEDQREQINDDINQAQQRQPGQARQPQPFVVEVKVNAQGHAVPVSLWVRERNYRF